MASITLSVSDELKNKLKQFLWVNWSEIARLEARKKVIFENYMKKKDLTDREWAFCEKIDWHPVDELPIKEEYMRKLKRLKKEKGIPFKNINELRKIIEG